MKRVKLFVPAFFLLSSFLCEAQQSDYNLGFEEWNSAVQFGSLSDMPTNTACYIKTADDLEGVVNNGDVQGNQILEKWSAIPSGLLRSTDAHSGNYAAVVCMWYNGSTGMLSFGQDLNVFENKVHFGEKIYGISGYYKFILDSLDPNDTHNKHVIAHIKTYKLNATSGALETLSNDSLIFTQSETYQPFQLIIQNADTNIVPDSVRIEFESNGYGSGTTSCGLSHFLYLDDLIFRFSPTSVGNLNHFKEKLNIFPNPANDNIHLQYDKLHIQSLKLADLLGRILKTFPTKSKSLDVSGLSPGIYFLQVKTKEGTILKKIVLSSRK